jgi:CRP-like cAMP-binding protein
MDKPSYQKHSFPKGHYVFKEGEPAPFAYLIEAGTVEVFKEIDGKQISLAKLGAGEIFGEMGLITDDARAASVKALVDCHVIVIDRRMFKEKLASSDPTVRAIVKMLSKRIVASNQTYASENASLEGLVRSAEAILAHLVAELPASKRGLIEQGVRPRFDSFVSAVRAFQDRMPE